MLADTIIRAIVTYFHAGKEFAVIGLGGYGARDLNIGSDLDLLFISAGDGIQGFHGLSSSPGTVAEELIRFLAGYTAKGFAYKIDMRLRPDGSRGILVNNIEGYKAYYLSSAQAWEIQSLLRARPVAGDMNLLRTFQLLKKQVILQRGQEMKGSGIQEIRKRIISEVSKESSGYDIKNGPGGIKEIEFLMQYLQLKHAAGKPDLIVHDTMNAFKRLSKYAILDRKTIDFLLQSHRFLKAVDTLLRFNEEDVVRADSELLDVISGFLKMPSTDMLLKKIEATRRKVYKIAQTYYEKES
jgi:glutamate-ammonia-ligase adenylyltransferase